MNISQQSDNCDVHSLKNKSAVEAHNQQYIYYFVYTKIHCPKCQLTYYCHAPALEFYLLSQPLFHENQITAFKMAREYIKPRSNQSVLQLFQAIMYRTDVMRRSRHS
jgi:hypothetical protein